MAMCIRLVCQNCAASIEAWDEGNPYYLDNRDRSSTPTIPTPRESFALGMILLAFVSIAASNSRMIQENR